MHGLEDARIFDAVWRREKMENNFRFASASISDRGLSEKRPVNEDSFIELGRIGLFAVADGVGGAQAGDVASQMAMEILGEAFANLPENLDAEDAMRVAIEHANAAIHNMANELPQLSSMATTIAALHVSGNIATIGHVGDSRVYRIEPDGTLQRETADHSVVEEEVRAGRMTPEQALTHPSRNVISRALGAEETVDVDLKTIMVDPGTMFLLCSDGITRHIGDEELAKLFHNEIEPELLVEQMKELCYKRGAEDNLTAVVVRISTELAGSLAASPVVETHAEAIEVEEETVATARSPFDDTIQQIEPEEQAETAKTEDFKDLAEELDDEGYLQEPEESRPEASTPIEYASSSVVVPAQTPSRVVEDRTPFAYAQEEKTSGGLGSLLSSILLVLLGAALGFGGYYFWQQANPAPEVPVINQSKSNNIPLTAFEEGRRAVDSAPERYLAANAASPEDAEDHYLLGRAQLLTGKYVEAKNQFRLAKERLAQVDPANAKTLAAEIALGLAVVDNPTVAEAFAKEISSGGSQQGNTNTSISSNAPIR
jgi:serine/threonine protein phosphatase PrpC